MNKLFKICLALACALVLYAVPLSAQFTLGTNSSGGTIYKVTGMTLTALTTGSAISQGDVIVIPWVSSTNQTASATGDVYFTATASGSSPGSLAWSTKGDIGTVSGTQSGTSPSSTIAINTINKNVRSTTTDRGQSKGRVYFSWINSPNTCGPQVVYFDVIKSFSGTNINDPGHITAPIPPIIGPTCLLPNTVYTYSVDPIISDNIADQIGIDRYFWDINAVSGATNVYYSTDSSSITFQTGSSVPNATISCGFGVANNYPWLGSSAAYSTLNLQSAVAAPTVSVASTGITPNPTSINTFPASICLNTNSSTPYTSTATFSVTAVSGYSYIWSWTPTNWTSTPIQPVTGTSVTITTDNNPGVVTLTSVGPCGDLRTDVINVNRKYNSTAMFTLPTCTPNGSDIVFTIAGGASSAGNLLTTPAFNGPSYTGLPSGWTASYITAGALAGQVTLHPGTAPAVYTVSIGNACTSPVLNYTNVGIAPAAPGISFTNNCATSGNTIALSTATVTGVTYSWSRAGGTGYSLSPLTGISSTLTVGTAGSTIVSLYETIGSSCNSPTTTQSFGIALAAAGPISLGCTVLNQASTIALSIPTVSGATSYTWSVSPAGTLGSISGSGASVNFLANGASGTATYSVTATDGTCNSTATASFNLSSTPAPFTLNGPTYEAASPPDPAYAHLDASGGGLSASYKWYNCGPNTLLTTNAYNGANPTTGNSQWNFTTPNGSNVINYGAQLTKNGCVYRICKNVTGYANRLTGETNTDIDELPDFGIYPNPNNGRFVVDLNNTLDNGALSVYDASGKKVIEKSLKPGNNSFDFKLPAGIYQMKMSADGKERTEKMVIVE